MNFDELLSVANRGSKEFLGDEKGEPISPRTLRYWISRGVLEKRGTRGPNTTYPDSFVWRVILVRQYQLFCSMTLDEIANAQAAIADNEVKGRVDAFRQERLESGKSKKLAFGSAVRSKRKSEDSSTRLDAEYFESIAKEDPDRPRQSWLMSEAVELDEQTRSNYLSRRLFRRLDSHEQALRASEGLIRETLAIAADRSNKQMQDEFRRLSQDVDSALAEVRDQSREMHAECIATMHDLARTGRDLRQKIDYVSDEITEVRKFSSATWGNADAPRI